ncbi:hypothetical protein CRYUN_Cryun26dG0095300 [Craigia yunnanensis]
MESDEKIRRVPKIGGEASAAPAAGSLGGPHRVQPTGEGGPRKRGRNPADKENKRLKRLLRNRVSAQEARERKKAYLNEMKGRVKDLEKNNSELEERLSTLQNENQMLRQLNYFVKFPFNLITIHHITSFSLMIFLRMEAIVLSIMFNS